MLVAGASGGPKIPPEFAGYLLQVCCCNIHLRFGTNIELLLSFNWLIMN